MATLLCAGTLALPAAAQTTGGLQSNVGADTRIGDLRPDLESYFAAAGGTAPRPKWLIQPSIDVQVGATDNVSRQASPVKGDIFTIITPSVVVSGDTARLKVNVSYSPQITEYASTPRENQISQFGTATGLLTVVPDLFFIDARGNVTQQSLTAGGFYQGQTQTYNQQNDVQTTTVSINPYLERRFGGYGRGRVGYTFSRTMQDQQDQQNGFNQSVFNNAYANTGNLTTQREDAFYSTGENLGRYNDQVTASAVQYSGVGSYRGAYRNEISNQVSYALDHTVTLLASFGYQNIRYGGNPGIRINQPSYDAGARYAPNPDTSITVEYGQHDGDNNLSFDGRVAITSRIRLVASYSTGITSDLEQSQGNLSNSSVSSTGLVTNTATGLPNSGASTGFSGLQNGIYRLKRFSASVLFLRDRDSYSISINNDDRTSLTNAQTLLGNGTVPAGTHTNGTYASASWQHDLAPDLNSNLSIQYGVSNSSSLFVSNQNAEQTTFSATAALTKQLTETLSTSLRYVFTDQSGGQIVTNSGLRSGTYTSNSVYLGVHKSF